MFLRWRAAAPQLLLLSMIAIWGASYAAAKTTMDHGMPPLAMLAARFWLAVLCLLPATLASGTAALRQEWRRGVATGLVLLLGYSLQMVGMAQTTASMGGFLAGLITLLVALGAVVVFGERLQAPTVLGLALGTAGLALLCFCGDRTGEGGSTNTRTGIALQVGSSVAYAGHILLLSRLSRRGTESAYSWWQLLTTAIGVTALLPLQGLGDTARWATDATVWWCIAYLGVFALALGITVQSRVQPRIPASRVSLLFATQPGFAALGGVVFLGDRLSALEWTGGASIAIGVLLAQLLQRPRVDAGVPPRREAAA